MINSIQDIQRLKKEFEECQKLLVALGDETRQYLLSILLECNCEGFRVVDIVKICNLSKASISHHLQIMKDAQLIDSYKKGTCVYYYFDPSEEELNKLSLLIDDTKQLMSVVPRKHIDK